MPPRLVLFNVPAEGSHSKATLEFYGTLLGRKMVRSLSKDKDHARYHAPASHGVQISVSPKHSPRETVTCYFAVPDIKAAIKQLEASNGKVVADIFRLPSLGGGGAAAGCSNERFFGDPDPTLGDAAILQDPAGNLVGIIQLNQKAEVWFQGEVTPAEVASYNHGASIAAKLFSS